MILPNRIDIGRGIERHREAAKMSREQLAIKADILCTSLLAIELGKWQEVPYDTIARLVAILHERTQPGPDSHMLQYLDLMSTEDAYYKP